MKSFCSSTSCNIKNREFALYSEKVKFLKTALDLVKYFTRADTFEFKYCFPIVYEGNFVFLSLTLTALVRSGIVGASLYLPPGPPTIQH